jgi:putative CocE/NonD family hydrolase
VDFKLLRQAMSGRPHWGPEDYAKTTFRDEPGANGFSIFDSSPAKGLADIRKQRKPVQYWGSWVDGGTAEAALARFRSTPGVPAEVWITANDHHQSRRGDPLTADQKSPLPSLDEQLRTQFDFQDRVLHGQKIDRLIHYYVMGSSGAFRTTDTWPPVGLRSVRLALDTRGQLTPAQPAQNGTDRYNIDVTATTGKTTRWSTQGGASPDYPDRRDADRKLEVYDGPAQTQDMELAGTPVVTLHLAASFNDPAVFVYLEDVAPDGRVTYLTEGELRAIHRKPADPSTLPYDQGPAPHSFNRADALLVIPGEVMTLQFALQPVAALIRKGHWLRLAIAGADADTFHRYPPTTQETFLIHRGTNFPSNVEVSLRPWSAEPPAR